MQTGKQDMATQVPGFTHPVTDVLLDELLPMIGYRPPGNFWTPAPAAKPKIPRLSPEQQARLDEVIFNTFIKAGDADFQTLLEVIA